jgi:Carboxypeptidase regulatory-like domain/TonB dependent receptor
MKRSSLAVRVILLIACVVAGCGLAQAQYRTSIQGAVTDASGALVSGATLTLTNPATGEKQVRTSNDAGVFNFNALPASVTFRLEVEKKGFAKKVIDNVALIPEQPNAVNVQLEIGAESQTITVNAAATPLLQTETASVSGVVSSNQIQHMPSFGRDVIKLAQLAPGSFGDNSQGSGGGNNDLPGTQSGGGSSGGSDGIFKTENGAQIISNGTQTENNGITIDGISTVSAVWGGSTVITPSEDSVESVKIVSNSYDAEDGRFNGAQVKITTKGGTNEFHGSAFFTAHRPGLNAYQRFNGQGNSDLRDDNFFDQLGGSIGGPIWKNKVFAFFNYETAREPNSNDISNGWYDTAAFDALAPAGKIATKYLTFPGNGVVNQGINNSTCTDAGLTEGVDCRTIPGQGLNVGSPLTTGPGTQDLGWTSSTTPGVGGGLANVADIANYIISNPTTSSSAQYNGRLDADISAKDHIAFAIYWVPQSNTTYNGNRAYDLFHHSQINDAFSAIWNHTFSPNFLNEARVNAAGYRWNELNSNSQSPIGLPSDTILQTGNISVSSFGPNVGSILNQWTYSYKDVATKIMGRHTVKFGGEITRLFYLQDCAGCGVPSYQFFNMWDFLNDAPQGEQYTSFNPTNGLPSTVRQDQRTSIWGFFVQDDFKLRPNLTVNLGLRWSYFSPLRSKENNMFVAEPGAGSDFLTGLTVRKGDSWNAQKDNFGPEVGFAWSPKIYHDRLVVRGGYGLNYNQEQIAISANVSSNPGLSVSPSFVMSTPTSPNPGIVYAVSSGINNLYGYPANPNAVLSFGPNGLPVGGVGLGVEIFPHTLPTQFSHHYSLDTQYDIGRQWMMTLGYQGSLSRNTFFHSNPNAIPAAEGYALNPQIGGGDNWGVNGSGNYNALLSELKHDFSHQFMADAQFTFARSMDTSSSPYSTSLPPYSEPYFPYAPNLNYGRSDYNVAKAFKLYGVYQPVIFHGSKGWIDKIVGGWSLSPILNIHSGFPWYPVVSVNNGSLYCGTCGYTALLPGAYLGGAGNSTSNDQFKNGSNYPLVASQGNANAYFSTPNYTAYSGTTYGNALPQVPGVRRNSLTGPGYRDVDVTLAKGFGLPNNRILGENARLEFRIDAYNVFNNLNFNPTSISNNIANPNFGQDTAALAARTATLGARFSF